MARKFLKWSKEHDDLLISMVNEGGALRGMTERFNECFPNDARSSLVIRKRLIALGIRTQGSRRQKATIGLMNDFLFVHKDKPLAELRKQFNAYFGTNCDDMTVYRMCLEARADRERKLGARTFRELWLDLQKRLSPQGAERPQHWLWRWRRLDGRTDSRGCVFKGQKDRIPMSDAEFRREWQKMQALFGVNATQKGEGNA